MSFCVLVVEDDSSARRSIIKSLKMSGLHLTRILEAEDGKKGLEALEENNVDFVLVDLNLPVMTGDDMVRRLRENPDTLKIPVVFISGEVNEERIQSAKRKGCGFITKPFTPHRLAETIINMISDGTEENAN